MTDNKKAIGTYKAAGPTGFAAYDDLGRAWCVSESVAAQIEAALEIKRAKA